MLLLRVTSISSPTLRFRNTSVINVVSRDFTSYTLPDQLKSWSAAWKGHAPVLGTEDSSFIMTSKFKPQITSSAESNTQEQLATRTADLSPQGSP